jgi:hypothetical protein
MTATNQPHFRQGEIFFKHEFIVVFQCHHMSVMDFVVSLLVMAEV